MKNINTNDIDIQYVFDMLPTAALVRWHNDIGKANVGQAAAPKTLSRMLYKTITARPDLGNGQVRPYPTH